jgi:hypothetical protein
MSCCHCDNDIVHKDNSTNCAGECQGCGKEVCDDYLCFSTNEDGDVFCDNCLHVPEEVKEELEEEKQKAFEKELSARPCSDCGKKCPNNYVMGGKDNDGKMRKACMPCKKKEWKAAELKYKK